MADYAKACDKGKRRYKTVRANCHAGIYVEGLLAIATHSNRRIGSTALPRLQEWRQRRGLSETVNGMK